MILLGKGVFAIAGVPIGLTRGGGQFNVEKEIRQIEADGDRGPVKDRIVQDKSIPKLTMNSLEVINENIDKMYSAITKSTSGNKVKITGAGQIKTSDFQPNVTWTGQTKNGKEVIITVENAINLENIEWGLADKEEVISALTYTGCYLNDSPEDYEPWNVEWISEE